MNNDSVRRHNEKKNEKTFEIIFNFSKMNKYFYKLSL